MSNKFYLEDFAEATIAQKGTSAEIAELKSKLTQKAESEGKQLNDLWYRLTMLKITDSKRLAEISQFIADERALKGGNAGVEFEAHAAILEKYGTLTKNIINQAAVDQAKLASGQAKVIPVTKPVEGGEEKIINNDTLTRARAAMKSREITPPDVEIRATAYN